MNLRAGSVMATFRRPKKHDSHDLDLHMAPTDLPGVGARKMDHLVPAEVDDHAQLLIIELR